MMSDKGSEPPLSRRTQELVNDAAMLIYNLGVATTDSPAHERFGLIAKVVGRALGDAIRQERQRLLESSNN